MAKAKKKTLPKTFEDLLKDGDLAKLKAVFDDCAVDARGASFKQTTLAFNQCPDELARWLVEQGADLEAGDAYGETPLHARSGHWQGRIEVLLDLGADVHARDSRGDTPLHKAAGVANAALVRALLDRGADANAQNDRHLTPLAQALERCSNSKIAAVAEVAKLLPQPSAPKAKGVGKFTSWLLGEAGRPAPAPAPDLKAIVTRIGTDFEFHRAGFNPDFLAETDAGLSQLYALFDVPPVPRRTIHDGRSPIIATAKHWQDQHQELWELLVPSSGAADTVQGEVVRVSGRIHIELNENGGGNWDAEYGKMARALVTYFGSGAPLPETVQAEAQSLASNVRKLDGASERLCELAVEWVALNPGPLKLSKPSYRR